MSREIKFRAWNKHIGKMFQWEKVKEYYNMGVFDDSEHIMQQFTGIRDRNDREVYEGDVVKAWIYEGEEQILPIRFENGAFVIDFKDSEVDIAVIGCFAGSIEIIGNVHENPELI